MSVTVIYTSSLTVRHTLPDPFLNASLKTVTIDGLNTVGLTVDATTTLVVTAVADMTITLSSGAHTIDLTALTSSNGAPFDATGLKLKFAKLMGGASNTHVLTIGTGASNGYLCGIASVRLYTADEVLLNMNSNSPVVGSGAKTLDCVGTGSETLNIVLVFG